LLFSPATTITPSCHLKESAQPQNSVVQILSE
jgi:hypothetical protein